MKSEIIYGFYAVYEALRAARRQFFEIYIDRKRDSPRLEALHAIAANRSIPIKTQAASQFKAMLGPVLHQGVAAHVSSYPLVDIHDLLESPGMAAAGNGILLLDTIQDPHNLGAIIRTASCVGMAGVVIPKDRSVSPSATVSRASAGALEHIRLARVNNLARTVKLLKEHGRWVIGLDRDGAHQLYATDLRGPLVIVVGGEQKGIRPLVKRHCDRLVSIPQVGPVNALNASVASAVVMYESYRQRHMLLSTKTIAVAD